MAQYLLDNSMWLIVLAGFIFQLFHLYTNFVMRQENKVEPDQLIEAYFLIHYARRRAKNARSSQS